MLLRTFDKINELFDENLGYLNFGTLKEHGITAIQIKELVENGAVECFSRGWYWCNSCGRERPKNNRYIEIGMVNPNAVICMDSACYLHGILDEQPDIVSVATSRQDRSKMEFDFATRRYYFQNTGAQDEVELIQTEYGSYKVYSIQRTICDCVRCKNELGQEVWMEIAQKYKAEYLQAERLYAYAEKLRARKNVQLFLSEEQESGGGVE